MKILFLQILILKDIILPMVHPPDSRHGILEQMCVCATVSPHLFQY